MKFTKDEIILCEQVAKKYIKEVKYGEWYLMNNKPILCAYANKSFHKYLEEKDAIIPLWTLSDCLEFWEEKGWNPYDMSWICEASMKIVYIKPGETSKELKFKADTLLEACLKAVVAVLEEK